MLWVYALFFGAGLIVGIVFYRTNSSIARQKKQLQQELDSVRAQFAEHQKSVNNHFHESAQLFEQLSQHYSTMYKHLGRGAHQLCTENISLGSMLPESKPQLNSNTPLPDPLENAQATVAYPPSIKDYAQYH